MMRSVTSVERFLIPHRVASSICRFRPARAADAPHFRARVRAGACGRARVRAGARRQRDELRYLPISLSNSATIASSSFLSTA